MEGKFKKKVGKVAKESPHTITFLPKHAKKEVIFSKRGVAKPNLSKKNPEEKKEEKAGPSTSWEILEESSEDETYVPQKKKHQQVQQRRATQFKVTYQKKRQRRGPWQKPRKRQLSRKRQ